MRAVFCALCETNNFRLSSNFVREWNMQLSMMIQYLVSQISQSNKSNAFVWPIYLQEK